MKEFLLVLLIVLTIANLFAERYHIPPLKGLTKPLLMPTLFFLYFIHTSNPSVLVFLALLFAFLGDIVLLDKRNFTLYLGTFSFLISHLFYIIIFSRHIDLTKLNIVLFLVVGVYIILGFLIFQDLQIPSKVFKTSAFIYMVILMTMSYMSLLRITMVSSVGGWLPFFGSLLFILSDSLIALGKLRDKDADRGYLIMLTYVLAQFFIVFGLLYSGS